MSRELLETVSEKNSVSISRVRSIWKLNHRDICFSDSLNNNRFEIHKLNGILYTTIKRDRSLPL